MCILYFKIKDVLVVCRSQMKDCEIHGSGWPNDPNFNNMKNLLCQLNSVHHVSNIWQRHHEKRNYYAVIYARPDVLFDCNFPVHYLENLKVRANVI